MSPLLHVEHLKGSSRRAKATRAIIFVTLLISAGTCLAPGLYASTNCDRWIKEYHQGLLQARAARRLRMAKARLLVVVHRAPSTAPHRHVRRQMGPLEALRRFQVDCGALDEPVPTPIALSFPFLPIETPPLETTTLAEVTTPALVTPEPPAPNVFTPVAPVSVVSVGQVPEPGSWLLVLTGGGLAAVLYCRRFTQGRSATYGAAKSA